MADPTYKTVVIRMPEDPVSRGLIADTPGFGKSFHGGVVTAVSSKDEITGNEKLYSAIFQMNAEAARIAVEQDIRQDALRKSGKAGQPVVGAMYCDAEEDLTVTVTEIFTDRVFYTGDADGDATLAEFNKHFKSVPEACLSKD